MTTDDGEGDTDDLELSWQQHHTDGTDGGHAENPALSDGLDDDTEPQTGGVPPGGRGAEDTEEHVEEAPHKGSAVNRRNSAPFLNRQRILLAVLGSTILVIILCALVIPMLTSDQESEAALLDKRGQVHIPAQIDRWEPEPYDPFPRPDGSAEERRPEDEEAMSEKDIDEILAELPYSDEAQADTAPARAEEGAGGGAAASARPSTNRNEQQKPISRMTLSDTAGSGQHQPAQAGNGGAAQGTPYSSQSYGQYAQERMSRLLSAAGNEAQNNQGSKLSFQQANAGDYGGYRWNGDHALEYGTIIPAALVTGINTDLPGVVIARVTSNVWSRTGEHLLIPAGTRVFATYNSSVSYGQDRVQVAWNKMIRPDGLEIDLGNFTGVDNRGFAGYSGLVNNHPFEHMKALGLIAAFSVLDTKYQSLSTSQDNLYAQNVLADTYSEMSKMTGKIADRALDIQPTITIPQGTEVSIVTNVTMELPSAQQKEVPRRYVRTR